MSTTTIFPYTLPSNYTLVDAEIASGRVQLLKEDEPALNFDQDFSSGAGFAFEDPLKAEVAGGFVRQIDQTEADSVMAGLMATKDLNWNKTDAVTGTLNGTPIFGSGEMVCTGTQGAYWVKNTAVKETIRFQYRPNYTTAPPANINIACGENGTNNDDRFNLTHSPSGNNMRMTLYDDTGSVVIAIATIFPGGAWEPTAGVQYEFALVIDSVAGTVRLFIDGSLHGTIVKAPWTRGTLDSRYYLGACPAIYDRAEADFDDCIWYDEALWTASYTAGYTIVPNIYAESYVTLPAFSYVGIETIISYDSMSATEANAPQYSVKTDAGSFKYWTGSAWAASDGTFAQSNDLATFSTNLATHPDALGASGLTLRVHFGDSNSQMSVDVLQFVYTGRHYKSTGSALTNTSVSASLVSSFIASVTEPADSSVLFAIQVSGQLRWWTGTAWADSDGSASQMNTASDINANLATLLSTGSNLRVFARLNANTAQDDTPLLDSSTITYIFDVPDTSTPNLCNLYGTITDPSGAGISGVEVSATLKKDKPEDVEEASGLLVMTKSTTTTDADGEFALKLIPSTLYEGAESGTYIINFKSTDEVHKSVAGIPIEIEVPDEPEKDIADLITIN